MIHLYHRNRTQVNTAALWLLATAALTTAVWLATHWPPYPTWLAAASLTTAVAYAFDKARATAGRNQRLPESSLHLFSLLGGFVGGAFGLFILRHKSNFGRHPLFPILILLSTLAHGLALWLTS
jgi:uncharacterized membrane protein YsdA (DUF1294 family)